MINLQAVVITGASSGIGAAIAKQLCEKGITTYALARGTAQLEQVKKTLPQDKQEYFIPVTCDISSTSEVNAAFKDIFAKNKIDMVVNNAGIGFNNDFLAFSDAEIDQVIATNIRGTISVTRAALNNRDPIRHLQIVNTTSLFGRIGCPQLSIYSASKFAVEGLTESLRLEFTNEAVGFTVLRPGITDTAFFGKAGMEQFQEKVKDLKSYFSPDQVATIFLARLRRDSKAIVVGNDKIFLALLPFIPFSKRFNVLDLVNKL
jgi:short-subunit dehydrogenase